MSRGRVLALVGVLVLLGAAAIAFGVYQRRLEPSRSASRESATFVGSQACAQCHLEQVQAWAGSHHDLAMQEASATTVLGSFTNLALEHDGAITKFSQRDGRFLVTTPGPGGRVADFDVRYVFGVAPLQQYLLALGGGRLQAFGLAWDTRPPELGGQRWFDLYPNDTLRAGDPLHWTGRDQNWNHMCAECHSTNLQRGYDATADAYNTTWSDLNVACEACHGPGSRHIEWVERDSGPLASMLALGGAPETAAGFAASFDERKGVAWTIDAGSGNARRNRTVQPLRKEVETCGRCHARRSQLAVGYLPGQPLLETHRVSLLEAGLYEADGQIHDEVYEYGSFLQSKMYAAGVTCSDCHDPHALTLRAPGNALCAQCHAPAKYANGDHDHHEDEALPKTKPGRKPVRPPRSPSCIDCHMPSRTYMVVDERHDHGFRVPRPDLSVAYGTPNACNDCHQDETPEWALDLVRGWYPPRNPETHFAGALSAARSGALDAGSRLLALAADHGAPAIVRATALEETASAHRPDMLDVIRSALKDEDPLLRMGALQAIEPLAIDARWQAASGLLTDPVRGVRVDAAVLLASTPVDALSPAERSALDRGVAEYVSVQELLADRPEARVNLGGILLQRGDASAAEEAYRAAIALAPDYTPAYVNLADLYRALEREDDAVSTLKEGLVAAPGDAAILHALGLALVRQKRLDEALPLLEKAATTEPSAVRYAYVYAVALESVGRGAQAIALLEASNARRPNDTDVLAALVDLHLRAERRERALHFAEKLLVVQPGDERLAALITALRASP